VIYRLGIISLAHVPVHVTDFPLVNVHVDELDWHSLKHPLTKHKINKFKPLMLRIEDAQINQVIESSKQSMH
jgi:methionyl-tRNA synthetase